MGHSCGCVFIVISLSCHDFAEVPLSTKPYCHAQVEALKVNGQQTIGTHVSQQHQLATTVNGKVACG